MKLVLDRFRQFIASEDGPTAVEYAVVVALIIIVCMAAIGLFGTAVAGWFTNAAPTVDGLATS
jgi:pilus assembly protein Flp/PilA